MTDSDPHADTTPPTEGCDATPATVYMRNVALASMAGQAGCSTVILIFAALFAGLFLDSRLDTRPLFTLGLILLSIPLSLYAMVRMMLSAVGAIQLENPYTSRDGAADRDQDERHEE
jgi:hypothetical protein